MNKEEYKNKLEAINEKASKDRESVHIDYANYNNIYKKGDILQDHHQIIRVEEIKYTMHQGECICNYRGEGLTKKLVPFKNSRIETMYGSNVKTKLN
tara:strand:- start:20218 stop:20508 length:291 start_codon:yes stop_codon:yes gene_type:complete